MAEEVRVDPAVLDAVSGACDDLRDDVGREEAGVEEATTEAARGLAGWYCHGSLENLVWLWREDLTKLSRYLDHLGTALRNAANAYRYTDHASADDFRALDR